jgi:uncharacterized membrane protein
MEALMQAAPVRFLTAALWPVSIWTSLTHLEEHPADDYVERTSPIVATAIAFWLCVVAVLLFATPSVHMVTAALDSGEQTAAWVSRAPGVVADVLWFFLPVLYVIGFWLFTTRDAAFPR